MFLQWRPKHNQTDQERAFAVTRQGCQPGIDDRQSGVIPHTRPGRWRWRSSQGPRQALPVSASPVWEGLVWEARQRMATAWPPRCFAPCRRCPEDAPLRPQWSGGRQQSGWPRHIDWDGVSLLSSNNIFFGNVILMFEKHHPVIVGAGNPRRAGGTSRKHRKSPASPRTTLHPSALPLGLDDQFQNVGCYHLKRGI